MATEVRSASVDEIASLVAMRAPDEEAGPADARMARYLAGDHHPGFALAERTILLAELDGVPIGYIGGHRTTRHGCDGELQYLYVVPAHRRSGVATTMIEALAGWFERHDVRRVCVDVVPENDRARAFYGGHGAEPFDTHWMIWEDLPASLGVATRP